MKRLLTCLLVLLAATAVHAQEKIAYTNVDVIVAFMPEAKAADQQLQTFEKKLQQKLEIKAEYYQTKLSEFQENVQKGQLSQAETEQSQKELQKLEQEIQGDYEKAEKDVMLKREELLGPLQTKIQGAINVVAKREGYTYVLNTAQNGTTNVLFGPDEANITEKVMKELGIEIPEEGVDPAEAQTATGTN